MNLESAEKLARFHMDHHGLFLEDWEFKFDGASRRFGQCTQYFAGGGVISLSTRLTAVNTCKRVLETILHELAHALVGWGHKHDYVWRAKCRELGIKDERLYSNANTVAVEKVKTY